MSELALPEGWVDASFDDALENISNGMGGKQSQDGVGIPVSRIETIANESFDFNRIGFIKEPDKKDVSKYLLNVGDILFSHINSAKHLGKTAIFKSGELYHGINLLRLEVDERITTPEYFNYYCNYLRSNGYFSLNAKHAVNQASINQKALKVAPITFPSLNEQKEIVRLLRTHITTVSQIQARLDVIPKLIEKFRQSVLNDAVTGRLTEDWRKDKRYETFNSYEIPASWTVLSIEEVADVKGGKRLPKGEKLVEFDTGYPYIRAGQLKLGTVVNTEEARSSQKYLLAETQKQIESYIVKENDAYITIVGASIGDAGLIPKSSDGANLTENAAKLTNYKKELNPVFLSFWLRSVWIQHEIKLQTKSAAQGKLALHRIKSLPFVYPTYEEQNKIVQSVEQFLAHADQIEKSVATAKARVDNLTQSILHQAFTGNLTAEWREQNPELITGDNSAEALLAKIKAEKKTAS